MNIRINGKDRQKESNWSGGKTQELAIYPATAEYLSRDFLWRLSTAQSDREESSFSRLEGYERILMVLEGDVVLSHGGERSVHLGAMEQDTFSGSTKTRCFGKLIRDYNLIMAEGCSGKMDVMEVKSEAEPAPLPERGEEAYLCAGVYCLDGYTVVSARERSEMVRSGEQAVIELMPGEDEEVRLMGEGRCVFTTVTWEFTEVMEGTGLEGDGASEAGGASAGEDGSTAREKNTSFAAEYGVCLGLYFRSNRWSKMLRREGRDNVYYDRPLADALRKLERRYVTGLIWLVGVVLCFLPVITAGKMFLSVGLAIAFTLVHLFLIGPFLYWKILPHPVKAHMKSTDDLGAMERVYHAEEIAENPQLEKLMRKYRSDDENYFTDESSPLRWLVKKK